MGPRRSSGMESILPVPCQRSLPRRAAAILTQYATNITLERNGYATHHNNLGWSSNSHQHQHLLALLLWCPHGLAAR